MADGIYYPAGEIPVTNDISIISENGAKTTFVDGGESNRCFNLADSTCLLSGFAIQNGFAGGPLASDRKGGGVDCFALSATVSNCVFSGNEAEDTGGGMHYGIAYNCTFSDNRASLGGGAQGGVVLNSSFFHNRATDGGGMQGGMAENCISWYNYRDKNFTWVFT